MKRHAQLLLTVLLSAGLLWSAAAAPARRTVRTDLPEASLPLESEEEAVPPLIAITEPEPPESSWQASESSEPGEQPAPEAPEQPDAEVSETAQPEEPSTSLPEESSEGEQDEAEQDEDSADKADYEIISEHEVIVYTFDQMRDLLLEDNGITTVYFGDDITATRGILIHANKLDVVFDGINPHDETNTVHSFTDFGTSDFSYTVRFTTAPSTGRSMTVRDMDIVGSNYYGPFSVEASVSNVTLHFERVTYYGPQFIHNRRGDVYMTDCDVEIAYNGASAAQELAECTNITFHGENVVRHGGGTRVLFFETGNGSLTLADGASLDVTVANQAMSLSYANSMTLSIGKGAVLRYEAQGRFNESPITELLIEEGGVLDIHCTGTLTDTLLTVTGTTEVREGATLRINCDRPNSTRYLLRSDKDIYVGRDAYFHVIAPGGVQAAVAVFGGSEVHFDAPKSVMIYNPGGNTIAYGERVGTLRIDAQQVNCWEGPAAWPGSGGIDDPPLYGWRRTDGTAVSISGTVANGLSGRFTELSHNLDGEYEEAYLPSAVTFNLPADRLLAFGHTFVTIDELAEYNLAVTGLCDALAEVRVSYETRDERTVRDTAADEDGHYAATLLDTIPDGVNVLAEAVWNGLRAWASTEVLASTLEIAVPELLGFETAALSSRTVLVPRTQADWSIVVTDTRGTGSSWDLFVYLDEPLMPANPALPALRGGLVIAEDGETVEIEVGKNTLVRSHTNTQDSEQVVIVWPESEGILARLYGGEGYVGQNYTATLHWNIADVP